MNDEQLAAELERRANAASPRPDWAERDLLPAVWHEIDARPVPVMTSRWSPLAGLAGLVVALLVLVVAVPRLTLAPPSATSAPSDTTSPERTVLETSEFYALLTSDQLEGKTVLVNGRIGPAEQRLGPVCGLQDLCYFGPLERTVRPLDVSVRGYATKEGPDAFELLARGGNPWRWWHRPVAPVEGTLLLSVDMFRNVEFLGRVSRSEALTWSIDAINRIEPGTIASDDVVLVEGWLNGVSGMRCLPLIDAVIEGLTNRYCSLEWIADGDETQSQPRVQVQRGAYHNFAPNATAPPFEPRQGTYALAPRLEGWCEGANPPCWQWTIVARVDAPTGPPRVSTPSPAAETVAFDPAPFAQALRAGELNGQTVLVNGRIGPNARRGPFCPPWAQTCYMGPLEGVDPPVDISARWTPSTEAESTTTVEGSEVEWNSWYFPTAPVEGNLVLSVDDSGQVEFVGHVRESTQGLTWSVAQAKDFDLESLGMNEVILVDGWLTGIGGLLDCVLMPAPGAIDGLPNRWCANTGWLMDGPNRSPYTQSDRAAGIELQNQAYYDFAQDPQPDWIGAGEPTPRQATYALARRLEGWCAAGNPPCWQWNIVARVDMDQSVAPSPTPPAPSTVECVGEGARPVTVLDDTGLIAGCRMVDADRVQQPTVTNPDGDLSRLRVMRPASTCFDSTTARFTHESDRYVITITEYEGGVEPGVVCAGLVFLGFELDLRTEVDASKVAITFTQPEPTPTPTPSAMAARFECQGPPLPPESTAVPGPVPVVIDETGLVESCAQTDVITELTGTISVSNPFEDDAIEVVWQDGLCDAHMVFTFTAFPGGYGLVGERPVDCADGGEPLPIYIRFTEPLPAENVVPSLIHAPLVGMCRHAETESDLPQPEFVDETGLVESCVSADGPYYPTWPVVMLENIDDPVDERLEIAWVATECETHVKVTFSPTGDRYVVTIDNGTPTTTCENIATRRIVLWLTQPVDAGLIDLIPPVKLPLECSEPRASIGAVVIDRTGRVQSCTTVEPSGEPLGADDLAARNPNGDLRQLQIEWGGSPCNAAIGLTLVPRLNGIEIQLGPRPDGQALGVEWNGTRLCTANRVVHAIRLEFTTPMDARGVTFSDAVAPSPSASPSVR